MAADIPPGQNGLLIAVDDLRAELGQYGNAIVRTPNMEPWRGRGSGSSEPTRNTRSATPQEPPS